MIADWELPLRELEEATSHLAEAEVTDFATVSEVLRRRAGAIAWLQSAVANGSLPHHLTHRLEKIRAKSQAAFIRLLAHRNSLRTSASSLHAEAQKIGRMRPAGICSTHILEYNG